MRISNWGMFFLAIYLIIAGLDSFGVRATLNLGNINGIIALIAGILILMEHWRR